MSLWKAWIYDSYLYKVRSILKTLWWCVQGHVSTWQLTSEFNCGQDCFKFWNPKWTNQRLLFWRVHIITLFLEGTDVLMLNMCTFYFTVLFVHYTTQHPNFFTSLCLWPTQLITVMLFDSQILILRCQRILEYTTNNLSQKKKSQ